MYLLSSVELNVRTLVNEEVFYTVDNNHNLISIGSTKDFTKGFNADVLATLDNTVYSQLNEGKVYVNTNPDSEASILSSGGALVVSDSSYAIPCTAKGIKKIQATVTGDTKFAISFDNRVTWHSMTTQYTLMPGSIVSSPVDISSNGEYIITSGTIPSGTEKLVMKLGQAGDTLPVKVSIQGRMTGGSSWTDISSFYVEEITSDDFDITENITGGYDDYRIYVQKVKDIGGSYVDDTTPLTFHITNLDYAYVDSSTRDWETISLDEIESKGMTASEMAALGYNDYANIYSKTQLNFAAYIPSGSTFTDFSVQFPSSVSKTIDFDFTCSIPAEVNIDFDVTSKVGVSEEVTFEYDPVALINPVDVSFDITVKNGIPIDINFDFTSKVGVSKEVTFEYEPVLSVNAVDVSFDITVKNGVPIDIDFDVTTQVLLLQNVNFDVTPILATTPKEVDFDFTGIIEVGQNVDYDFDVKVGLDAEIDVDISVACPVSCEISFNFGAGAASTFYFFA